MPIQITNGRILDPASGVDRVGDLWIDEDRIVDPPTAGTGNDSTDVFDATNCVVMAGGIDLHTHIGGGKVSLARMLLSESDAPRGYLDRDDAYGRVLPTAPQTADRYLDMGFTTCFEPAVIPCNARSAHAEMADVRGLDTGGYCLLGNDDLLLRMIGENQPQGLINDYVAWMVAATQCIAVKVVNAGGINAFKFNQRKLNVDTPHEKYGVTPAKVIEVLCRAVYEIGLVHPLHVHCSNLGVPGNIESTLATIRAANGLPIHLTHAQFHSYGTQTVGKSTTMVSAAHQLAQAVAEHPNVTLDVGQIMFGQTVTISADTMHQHENFRFADPRKSILVDVECEAGCGVVPFRYRNKQFVHGLQWAIGLELFLMIDDPSRVFLTTDHPNGAPFDTYPHLIRLLGDRSFRETAFAELGEDSQNACQLAGMDREYSLAEIATMTRSAPAKILGLTDRGHLATGAIADVAVYRQQADLEKMFATPELVIRSGQVVRQRKKNSDEISKVAYRGRSKTLAATPNYEPSSVSTFVSRYADRGTFAMHRLAISSDEMGEVIGSDVVDAGTRTQAKSQGSST